MKYLLSCYLLLATFYLYADVPGNKPRPSYDVTITGLNQYKDYTFYTQENDAVAKLKDSAFIHVPGGYGAPRCVEVWAMKNKNSINTDTLYFCSGDEKSSMKIIVHVADNHLTFGKIVTTKKTKKSNENINIVGDISSTKNHLIMYLISGLSFAILLALVFFVWKKNKQTKLQRSI